MNQKLSDFLGQIDFYGSTLNASYGSRRSNHRRTRHVKNKSSAQTAKKSKTTK